jgi:hypothetical protein
MKLFDLRIISKHAYDFSPGILRRARRPLSQYLQQLCVSHLKCRYTVF